jgi:SpoVK/Ycf46/Vps4 family AAA+-type ATPase
MAPDESRLDSKHFFDCDVAFPDGAKSLRAILKENLIDPHKPEGDVKARKYSAVFYGPPGTAKTTLAEAIAYALGWPYIYLQTSDFSGEGFETITGRARIIFTKLGMLSNAVILFDEVEEFVRDRDNASLPPESKMITTSMLSLIQDLRRRKNVLFIVTTNFLKNFDPAITRPGGRFDMLLLVPPPSLAEKKRMFKEKLWAHETLTDHADEILRGVDSFVDKRGELIAYFAFSEWSSFVEEAVNRLAVTPGDNAVEGVLNRLFDERKDGITISGTLRKDYDDSKSMVRAW